jgi:dCTP deaminase
MSLCDKEIIESGIFEINEDNLNSHSLNLTLSNKFGWVVPTGKLEIDEDMVIDPMDAETFRTEWQELKYIVLYPGEFILAGTQESCNFPPDVVGQILGRSSLGRLGLASTILFAGFIDGGFKANTIVLEIVNLGEHPIKLTPGMRINQIKLERTSTPYKDYSLRGRYQGQGFDGSKGIE